MTELVNTITGEIITTTRPDYVRGRLVDINRAASELYLENGLLLREYKETGLFRAHGYGSFDEAVEDMKQRGLLEYGSRQARNFIAIVNMRDNLQLSDGDLKDIGISKLREIATVNDEASQRKLLADATDRPFSDVQREAKQIRDVAAGRDVDPWRPIILKTATETQFNFFTECMKEARSLYALPDNISDAELLVDVILAAWYSSRDEIRAGEAQAHG